MIVSLSHLEVLCLNVTLNALNSCLKKRNLVLINNDTYQRETVSERPIRQPLRRAHIVAADNRRKATNVEIAKLWRQSDGKRGVSNIRWQMETTFNDNMTARDEWLRQGTEPSEQNRTLSRRWVTMHRRSPTTRDEVRRLAADWLAARNGGWRWVAVTMAWFNGRHQNLCVRVV